MIDILKFINYFLWDNFLIFVFLGLGTYFTIITKFVQIRKLPFAIKQLINKNADDKSEGTISPIQALYMALSSCVGNGNIVGVATSIASGGPGAVFWMWIAAILGAATKYSEIILGIKYREKDDQGNFVGGPIFYLTKGLNMPNLAKVFAFLLVIQSSGGNLIQSNALSGAVRLMFNIPPVLIGIILATTIAIVIVGGLKSLVKMAEKIVPFMTILYISSGSVVLILNRKTIPHIISLIINNAFNIKAGIGGLTGYSVRQAMRYGIARELYSNEAGEGSAAMIHAPAITNHPARQATLGIIEVFFDTLIVCSITAFIILSSGLNLESIQPNMITMLSFETAIPFSKYIVGLSMILFAFTTVSIQWYFGTLGLNSLIGEKKASYYKYVFVLLSFLGCIAKSELVWELMDVVLGLLCIPNIIALVLLSRDVSKESFDFDRRIKLLN